MAIFDSEASKDAFELRLLFVARVDLRSLFSSLLFSFVGLFANFIHGDNV